ncbi:MAG: sulfatase [Verrucomicrobiota bacterium]
MLRLFSLVFAILTLLHGSGHGDDRPNILWIIADDMSAHFSCYGETLIETPHVDRLAAEGAQFTKAFVTAPVCSTCRSALITGMYQTSIGSHHHRSGRGELKITLPEGIVPIPKLFQDAGYFTSINGWPTRPGKRGKTDYNFEWNESTYAGSHWSERAEGQPFFHQVQIPGGKLRGGTTPQTERYAQKIEREFGARTEASKVVLPPYYPDDPILRHDWAAYLDSVRETDRVVGEVVAELEEAGLLENTLVIFMTDHGISHARGKQFLYEEGIHVPLVMAGPGVTPGTVRDDLVEHVDLAALSLAAAQIQLPETMQGRDILASNYQAREAIFSARDRCDETVDHVRCVRTDRFKYIRNFLPQRPHLMPCAYKDKKSIYITLRELHAAGRLPELSEEILFSPTRAPEELYDLEADPFELNNLAEDPAFAETLAEMAARLEQWMVETNDLGRSPESRTMYDSDMLPYTAKHRKPGGDARQLEVIERNIALMLDWAAAGK